MPIEAKDGLRFILTPSDQLNDPFNSQTEWPRLSCPQTNQLALEFGNLSIDKSLTVQDTIATRQLSVSDTVSGSLTIENDLTVGNAIATRQLSVSDTVTGSLTIENNLTVADKVGIGTRNPSQALDMGGRGKNIKFNYTHIGETIGGAATIIANKARVSETENNRVDYSLDGSDGVSAIELLYTNGISFFTKPTENSSPTVEGEQFFSFADRTYERMRISSTGNVGIGTTNPSQKLDVRGNININGSAQFVTNTGNNPLMISRVSDADNQVVKISVDDAITTFHYINDENRNRIDFRLQNTDTESGGGANANDHIVMKLLGDSSGGKVGIGIIGSGNPQYPLHLGGGAYCDGKKWHEGSSLEYKQDVKQLTVTQALETLTELNPVTFRYKGEKSKQQVGFIAEEVPELVASNDRKGLSSMDIVGILTKVVKHQQREIDELKARLNRSS